MKVLYFTMEYPRATDTFIQREVAALRDCGIEIETSAARRPGDEHMVGDEQRAERDRTHYLLPPSATGVLGAQLRLFRANPRRWVRSARLAWDTRRPGLRGSLYQGFYFLEAGLLAEHAVLRPGADAVDHIHAHFGDVATSVAMLAAELADRPFSFTLHGPGVFFDANVWQLGTKIERAVFVSCISWFARSQAQLLSSEEAADSLHIVHCGVDPDRYLPVSRERSGGPVRLAFVARLDHVKGVTVLLEALAELGSDCPVQLSIVGDGPSRSAFERKAKKLGLADSVDFLGYCNQSEVAEVLAAADIFVLPSFAEGVPVSLMEAGAAGIPVIATNVGGVTELVTDGETGFVVPPGDVGVLADRIARLAVDPELRRRMGAAARDRVKHEFNSATEASRLATLFRSATVKPVDGSISRPSIRPTPAVGAGQNETEG